MHPSVEHVAAALAAAGARGQVQVLDGSARTAAQAATALGCDVGAIASSLVFIASPDRVPVLVLTSGAHRVDLPLAAAALGVADLTMADADTVHRATGQRIGGVAPVGHPQPLRTLVDADLARHPVVWAAGGHPHAVFPTTFDELVRMTDGTPAVVSG